MYDMININKFNNDLDTYEAQNLSFLLFQDIDFSLDKSVKSFYRADFRRSKLLDCYFYKNPFGRADFVDVYIRNTKFDNVDWGSCLFKNSYIELATYKNNSYRGVSLQFNIFKKCSFENENFIYNAYKCTFKECTFNNCTFEKSSLEDITFISCTFNNVNIAECHSENLKFDICEIKGLKLGVSYWSTYLYKNTRIEECTFMYQGKIVEVTDSLYFINYIDTLLKQDRLYEFLNCIIINNKMCNNIVDVFLFVMQRVNLLPQYIKNKTIIDILEMIKFYFNYEAIGYEDYSNIITILNNFDWDKFSFDISNICLSKIFEINRQFNSCNFSLNYLYTINPDTPCKLSLRLNFNNKNDAITYTKNLFERLNECLNNRYKQPYFNLIESQKGSIILTLSSYLLFAILLSYAYKKISHNAEVINFERVLSTSLQKKLANDNISLTDIKKICLIGRENNLLDTNLDESTINSLSKELTGGEIISLLIKIIF